MGVTAGSGRVAGLMGARARGRYYEQPQPPTGAPVGGEQQLARGAAWAVGTHKMDHDAVVAAAAWDARCRRRRGHGDVIRLVLRGGVAVGARGILSRKCGVEGEGAGRCRCLGRARA